MDQVDSPCIFLVAGPNGAGKSTTAPAILRDRFQILTYVNADVIAAGLSAFAPERAAFQAGRIMLEQLHHLRERKASFAFETTLSTRGYARWLADCRNLNFRTYLLFLSLPSAEVALERVARRVASGGHSVPADVVRRRFDRGLRNFFGLYRPLCDRWFFLDNGGDRPRLLAHGGTGRKTVEKSTVYRDWESYYGSE